MTPRQTTFSMPGGGAATLTLPQTLTLESISRLEQSLGGLFRMLRSDLREPAGHDAAIHDPGAIEYDSWAANLH